MEQSVSSYSREVAKGSVWGLIGSLLVKLSSFFYTILIARVVSQGDVGLFYLTLSFISLITIFSDLGLSGAITRYLPFFEGKGQRSKIKSLLNYGYGITLILGIVFSIALFLSADIIGQFFGGPGLSEALHFFAFFVLLLNIFRTDLAFLQGKADIRSVQLVSNLQNFFKLIITVLLLVVYGSSPLVLIAAYMLSYAGATLFLFPKVKKLLSEFPNSGEPLSQHEFLTDVLPLGIMVTTLASLGVIITSGDRMIMGLLMDPTIVRNMIAIYSIATALAVSLNILPGSITGIFLPVMSRVIGKGDHHEGLSIMQTAQRWTVFITVPAAVVTIIFSEDIMRIFYGVAYQRGWLVLSVFTTGVLLSTLALVVSTALVAKRMVNIELRVTLISAIINLILCFLLIPSFGIEGAALAYLVAIALSTILTLYYGKTIFGFVSPPEIYRILLAGIVTGILILLIKPLFTGFTIPSMGGEFNQYFYKVCYLSYIAILMFFSGIVFLVLSLALKCFHHEDVSLMKSALRKAFVPPALIEFAAKIATKGVKS